MNTDRFTRRRIRNIALFATALAALVFVFWKQSHGMGRASFTSGYVLMGCLVFLASFNLRKKLTFLPQLGSSALWMQIHIYIGLSTFAIFAFHIGWTIPKGLFEQLLACVYLFVAFSGVYGLFITRTIPKKLTALRTEPFFQEIPSLRIRLARQARELIASSALESEVLQRLYYKRLEPFFDRSRGLAYLLAPSSRHAKQLVLEIQKQDRYLAESDRRYGQKLAQLVRERDDLDYHFAMQGRLKTWLILHVGFTYSLLIISVVHGVMAHAFAGGIR